MPLCIEASPCPRELGTLVFEVDCHQRLEQSHDERAGSELWGEWLWYDRGRLGQRPRFPVRRTFQLLN